MSEEQSISVTMSDLKLLVDVEVIKTRMDTHDRASEERQKREEDLWKEVFDELKLIRQTQGDFPLRLEKCKGQIEEDMKREYITKTELKTMLRTAMFVGAVAVSVINGIFAFFAVASVATQREAIVREIIQQQQLIKLDGVKAND